MLLADNGNSHVFVDISKYESDEQGCAGYYFLSFRIAHKLDLGTEMPGDRNTRPVTARQ